MRTGLRVGLAAALLFVSSGCSSFHREWRAAGRQPAATAGLEGRWEGRWVSGANGHHGRLRAVITHTAPDTYRAHYHARYMRILSFAYAADLHARETNGVHTFAGEADLGKLAGGIYSYAGSVTGTNFQSTYKSKYDHGIYEMQRR